MNRAGWQGSVVAALAVMSMAAVAVAARPVRPKPAAGAVPEAKPEEKAPAAAAPEAKPAEAKAEEKTPEKKPDSTSPAAPAPATPAKSETKAAEVAPAPAAPAAPKPPPPEPAERLIEKREGSYVFKLTLRPGNLKPNRVADVSLEILRVLEIPDPVTGDRSPVSGAEVVAQVKPPAPAAPAKGRKPPPPPPSPRYVGWPLDVPGTYGLHFTPGTDGLFELAFEGVDPKNGEDGEPRRFDTTFRLGVGTAAAQTELSQGVAASRRSIRRPVGGSSGRENESRLRRLMEELGYRHLALEAVVADAPKKGPHVALAAEAREIAKLAATVPGLVPPDHAAAGKEFDALAKQLVERLEALAVAAEGRDRKAPRAKYEALEPQGCLQCHVKFRWGLTKDVAAWPKFEQTPWKK